MSGAGGVRGTVQKVHYFFDLEVFRGLLGAAAKYLVGLKGRCYARKLAGSAEGAGASSCWLAVALELKNIFPVT